MRTGPRSRAVGLCIASFLLLFIFAHCQALAPPPHTRIRLAEPATFFNKLFTRENGGWTGGDGTLSIGLPDGRSVWLFGDSFLGTVAPDGTRSEEAPFIRNCLVVQDGSSLETRFRIYNGKPSAFFPAQGSAGWYWPGDGTVEGSHLKIFLHRFQQVTPGLWGWQWTGTALATLSLPGLELESIHGVESGNSILYGVSVLETPDFTYLFGVEDLRHLKYAHVARVPAGRLEGPWTYFSGSGWSETPGASVRLLKGVSTQYAVVPIDKAFLLVTMDGRTPFSNEIAVYRSALPSGPWRGPLIIYRVPGTGRHIYAYNPFAHPQFTENGRLLISYNRNDVDDPTALYRDASIYRPRFIRVDLLEIERRFEVAGDDN
jgi:hypothetical protein